MRDGQAWEIVAVLKVGSVAQDLSDERLQFWHKHILPLPYETTLVHVRRWAVAAGDGPKFLSSIDDVLTACGVPGDARELVAEAAWEGGTVWPALEGWVRVDGQEPPEGYRRLRAMQQSETPALPDPNEERISVKGRVAALAAALRGAR
jgi:hypothetical protein